MGAEGQSSPLKSALSLVGMLVSQGAVLIPVLFYFGALYTSAWYGYFGVDSGLLGFSVIDFLRRSVTPVFWPLVLGSMVVLLVLAGRGLPQTAARRTGHEARALRIWYVGMLGLGTITTAVAPVVRIWGVPSWFPPNNYLLPGSLMAGSVLLGYATLLRASHPRLWASIPPQPPEPAPRPSTMPVMFAVLLLGVAGAFWGIGTYASAEGLKEARGLAASGFRDRPAVVVFSVEALGIAGTGVEVREIDVPGEKFRYYYSGVRLLDRTANEYFLIPQQWQARRDRVFIVARADTIRIDVGATHNN